MSERGVSQRAERGTSREVRRAERGRAEIGSDEPRGSEGVRRAEAATHSTYPPSTLHHL
jgi:hypothetical protein